MCGIIAVMRRPSGREVPNSASVVGPVESAVGLFGGDEPTDLAEVAELLESAAGLLAGVPGLLALVRDPSLAERLRLLLHVFPEQLAAVEGRLAESAGDPEEVNAALVRIRDVIWSISRDRLGAWTGVTSLASTTDPPGDAGLAVLLSVSRPWPLSTV